MKVLLVVIAFVALSPVRNTDAPAFNISLVLQGDCSDQITLICRHIDIPTDPNWIHNGTVEGGQLLDTAFPGAMYSVQSNTEHRVIISGVGNVQALDGYIIQCVYSIRGNLIKSNAVQYSFIPPDYRPALSLVSNTSDFSERLSTFTYSYQESCSLYPRCTPYFSVEHTVSPQSAVSNSSSGCSVEYNIHNLMRCVSYQSTATALIGSQRGNLVVVGDTVMQSPGRFTITGVSIGADRNLVNVTYMENESDCLGYPTEWLTVDVDGVQVADLTANAVQSQAFNHANGSVTLSLPLNQPLPENAVTLNMTKYNTVPTNRSDDMGDIVTEMVTWGTSAVFDLQVSSAAMNDEGEVSVGAVVGSIIPLTTIGTIIFGIVVVNTIIVALVIARKRKAKECGTVDIKPIEAGKAYEDGDGYKCIGRQPKVDLTRGNTAGSEVPQKTICVFGDDASTGIDHISDDDAISMQGQRTTQDLTYVTVDHSQPRPVNVPNENLDVQYTGVKFDTEAPAV